MKVGSFQFEVLQAIEILGGESYGTAIDRFLCEKRGEPILLPQVQGALRRMEKRGLIAELRREQGERLGRPRAIFALTPLGKDVLSIEMTPASGGASGATVLAQPAT